MLGGVERGHNRKEMNSWVPLLQRNPSLSDAFIVKRRWWFIPEQKSFVNYNPFVIIVAYNYTLYFT
jgi:hypothetical protein